MTRWKDLKEIDERSQKKTRRGERLLRNGGREKRGKGWIWPLNTLT